MSRITITPASILSLPAVHRLFAHAVDAHFTYFSQATRRRVIADHTIAKLARAALDTRRVVLVAKAGGHLIGYCLGAVPATGPAQIYWLYVDPDHRGANIGLSLLSRMLKALTDKGARTISIATHDHRRYYERQGFKFAGRSLIDGIDMDLLTFQVTT